MKLINFQPEPGASLSLNSYSKENTFVPMMVMGHQVMPRIKFVPKLIQNHSWNPGITMAIETESLSFCPNDLLSLLINKSCNGIAKRLSLFLVRFG